MVLHGRRQVVKQRGGSQAARPVTLCPPVRGSCVEKRGKDGGFEGRHRLRPEAGDGAGQDVARAGGLASERGP